MKFTSEDWYDGRYGTFRGEPVKEEAKVVEAGSWAAGFRALHGFVPSAALDRRGRLNGRWVPNPGVGFRECVGARSFSAHMHTIVQVENT